MQINPLIVAVGASAGGLGALRDMFRPLSKPTGMSFVVVQHLSPDHKSMMVDILARETALKVEFASSGIIPKADTIYVIEPLTTIRLLDGCLVVEHTDRDTRAPHPISVFFESVAHSTNGNCVGVVLSGTGTDGSDGLKMIRELGGTVVVQEPASASFDGMPQAALLTGTADLVLPPERIVPEIIKLYSDKESAQSQLDSENSGSLLPRLSRILRDRYRVDFTHYKPSTINRRIERRMSLLKIEKAQEYLDLVSEERLESAALYRELLIGVTRFHRDELAIEALNSTAIPRLLALPGSRPLRLWCAGCSTGQEAYTLSMLVQEGLEQAALLRDFRVFATDVDNHSLEQAASGEFDQESVSHLPSYLLEKYFHRRGPLYIARRSLRETILFSRHNVIEDPPFSRLDMITCRNLLIYFKPSIQERVLRTFSGSLLEGGLLWLGGSETVGSLETHFETLHSRWRIYEARAGRVREMMTPLRTIPLSPRRTSFVSREAPNTAVDSRLLRALELSVLGFAPPTLVVDTEFRLVYRHGDFAELLSLPQGRTSLDVRELLPEELSAIITTSWSRARQTAGDVLYPSLRISKGLQDARSFQLRVRRLATTRQEEEMLALIFENLKSEIPASEDIKLVDVSSELESELNRVNLELAHTRANLQSTIEELESANEELQSTNEELIAANEELQSTNEELQSVNEELHTVNSEHQQKLEEVGSLAEKVEHILEAINIGVLLLDASLGLQHFNSMAGRYVNILTQDLGRPLSHLTHSLDFPDLLDRCGDVLRGEEAVSRHTKSEKTPVVVRILPRGQFQSTVGVIVTITEASELINSEADNSPRESLQGLPGLSAALCNSQGEILEFSPSFAQNRHRDPAHLHGNNLLDMVATEERETLRSALESVEQGTRWEGILRHEFPGGSYHWEHLQLLPVHLDSGVCVLQLSSNLVHLLSRGTFPGRSDLRREYWIWNGSLPLHTTGLHKLLAIEASQLLTPEILDKHLRADDRESMSQILTRAQRDNRPSEQQYPLDRNGESLTLKVRIQSLCSHGVEQVLAEFTLAVEEQALVF